MDDMKTFGRRVAKRRKELAMNQNELAEMLDLSPNHLSSLENGKVHPSYAVLCKLCDSLKVTPDYLMMGSMHSDSIRQNTIDKLSQCSEESLDYITEIIDIFIEKDSPSRKHPTK